VFDWIDGENVQDERTKLPEYHMLAKVYTVPTDGLQIPDERFEAESATLFFAQWDELKHLPHSNSTDAILALFDKYQGRFGDILARLRVFCQSDLSHRYITHGDAAAMSLSTATAFILWIGTIR
jgi:hypothetical protein